MLSRRQFLQAAGIAVAAHTLPRLPTVAPTFEPLYGRALETLPIYVAPDSVSPLVMHLWSDTIVPILGVSDGWYQLPQGYAPRRTIQPMIAPARRVEMLSAPPFWAEVTAACAVVRAACAADAPLIARVGHGGVLRVIDYLPGDGINWYGIAEDENVDLLGWTQAAAWSPARVDDAPPTLALVVSAASQRLSVQDGDRIILTAPLSTGRDLVPGVYPVTDRQPNGTDEQHVGTPWRLTFGNDLHLSGVYWRNDFGAAASGAAIQVTPPLAKWLYPRTAKIIVS